MKLLITKSTVADSKCVSAGDIVDVSEQNARILIAFKKAVPAPDDVAAPQEVSAEPQAEAVQPESAPAEPATTKKGKSKK